MNIFVLNSKTYEVDFDPQVILLKPFNDIISRDKTKGKTEAKKELAFVWFYTDIKSDYQYITNEDERAIEIIKDLKLGAKWKIDTIIKKAIEFYKERSTTIKSSIYAATCKSVADINDYLSNTKQHLIDGVDITKITNALKSAPVIMKNIDDAYKELVKEQKETEGRSKGSRDFNMYEEGL